MLYDYHTHTCFSGDSDTPVRAMLDRAVSLGLKEICITDHIDYDYPDEPDLFIFNIEEYFSVLSSLKEEYAKHLSVRIGVEYGLMPHLGERLKKLAASWPFDFIIGSSHVVDSIDPYYPAYWEKKTEAEGIWRYFESILENLATCSDFDVYGHMDYIIRYVPSGKKNYSYEKYQEIIETCLKRLISMGKGIEINTAGFQYGLGAPNPKMEILRRYRELGGEIITVGSDAHKPEHLAYDFDKVISILKECGFRYFTVFHGRVAKFIRIDDKGIQIML